MLLSPDLNRALGHIVHGRVKTDDGVELFYQTFGEGPAIMIANGIGVRYPGVVRQLEALRDRYRVICWDYRGMGQSVMANADADVSMPRHARDALAILDKLDIERALLIGWSMGVQVALEMARHQPRRLAGLVAMLGTYGAPFRTAFPAPLARASEGLFAALQRHPNVAQGLLNAAVAAPDVAFAVLSRILFVGRNADRDVFAANVRSVAGVEKKLYLRTILAMASHDASDVLPTIGCPAMVISAGRDYLTPPRVGRQMASSIPGALYCELPRATHFALIEQPDQINAWLMQFARSVYDGAAATAVPVIETSKEASA